MAQKFLTLEGEAVIKKLSLMDICGISTTPARPHYAIDGLDGWFKRIFTPPAQLRKIIRYTGAAVTAPFVSASVAKKAFGLSAKESSQFEVEAKVVRGVAAAAVVATGAYMALSAAAPVASAAVPGAGTVLAPVASTGAYGITAGTAGAIATETGATAAGYGVVATAASASGAAGIGAAGGFWASLGGMLKTGATALMKVAGSDAVLHVAADAVGNMTVNKYNSASLPEGLVSQIPSDRPLMLPPAENGNGGGMTNAPMVAGQDQGGGGGGGGGPEDTGPSTGVQEGQTSSFMVDDVNAMKETSIFPESRQPGAQNTTPAQDQANQNIREIIAASAQEIAPEDSQAPATASDDFESIYAAMVASKKAPAQEGAPATPATVDLGAALHAARFYSGHSRTSPKTLTLANLLGLKPSEKSHYGRLRF